MSIKEEISRFLTSKHREGLYMVYAKDVINDDHCTGIYFIHEKLALNPKMKKITKPKKKVNIILVQTLYI